MKRCYLFLSLISAVWFTGCTNNPLNLDNAKEQITRYYEANPKELSGNLSFEAIIKGKDTGSNNLLFRLYINGGLMRLKEVKPAEKTDSVYIFEITEKGKPYVIKETLSADGYPLFVVKIYEYYISDITEVKYSPDKKKAAAFFNLPIRNITPFGENAADPNHKIHLIAFFQFDDNNWNFQRIEVNVDEL